jgi:hypothetical protein
MPGQKDARLPTILSLAFACGSNLVAGCTGGSATAGDAGVRPEAGMTLDASWADAATASSGAPPCAAADAGDALVAPHDMGTVIVEDDSAGQLGGGSVSVAFQPTGTVIAPYGCTMTTVGACQTRALCDLELPDDSCNSPNAGTVSLEDRGDAGSSISLTRPNPPNSGPPSLGGGGGWYPPHSFSGPPFVGGDVLTVTAEGGVVPAFFAQLVAPSYVSLIEPAPPYDGGSYGNYAIATSSDLAVSWTGGEADASVHVVLTGGQNTPLPNTFLVDCAFDASAGQGLVPRAALSLLKGRGLGRFVVYQQRVRTVQAGTFAVQIVARNACDSYANGLEGPCFVNSEGAMFE